MMWEVLGDGCVGCFKSTRELKEKMRWGFGRLKGALGGGGGLRKMFEGVNWDGEECGGSEKK